MKLLSASVPFRAGLEVFRRRSARFLLSIREIGLVWWHVFKNPPHLLILCGHYPDCEEAKDGFFQRVLAMDQVLSGTRRIYLEALSARPGAPLQRVGENAWHLRLRSRLAYRLFMFASWRIRYVFYHSSLSVEPQLLKAILRRRKTALIWDVHGAVPEELASMNQLSQAKHYARIEEQLAKKASAVLCVTAPMKRHIVQKYKLKSRICVLLPIIPNEGKFATSDGRTSRFVYAGGDQDWQCISVMIRAIVQTPVDGRFYFFVPNPGAFERHRRTCELATPRKCMIVDTASPADVRRKLSSMGFGFCLRAHHVLNRVAFPTKLAEYVAAGVVPILSYADIGDFVSDGLRYVPLSRFMAGELPGEAERQLMAESNYSLLEQWRVQMSQGAPAFIQLLDERTTFESLAEASDSHLSSSST